MCTEMNANACRWTRLLLLQQLLVEAIDVLDPVHVRVPAQRRLVLAPIDFLPLPNIEAYKERLVALSALEPFPEGIRQQLEQLQRTSGTGNGGFGGGGGGGGGGPTGSEAGFGNGAGARMGGASPLTSYD